MRAKLPRESGYVDRDGVKLFYEVYGDGPETMVFVPPWSIVHSRIYKAQLPYFSECCRCITYDARGNGKSDRPESVSAYSLDNLVADALAVMDATGVKHAIVVGLSLGGYVTSVLAAHHPDRVRAAILIGTVATVGPGYPYLAREHFRAERERFEGWDKYNRQYWLQNYPDFAEHFKLMSDMMTIAFQADLTRVMTFLVTHEGTSRAYRELGISDGHHPLTHHRNQEELMAKVVEINCYHMKQFAAWIEKLKSIKEGDGTLLSNSMIVYGAGLSDGNRHSHEDLPTLVAGNGGGQRLGGMVPGRCTAARDQQGEANQQRADEPTACRGGHAGASSDGRASVTGKWQAPK